MELATHHVLIHVIIVAARAALILVCKHALTVARKHVLADALLIAVVTVLVDAKIRAPRYVLIPALVLVKTNVLVAQLLARLIVNSLAITRVLFPQETLSRCGIL